MLERVSRTNKHNGSVAAFSVVNFLWIAALLFFTQLSISHSCDASFVPLLRYYPRKTTSPDNSASNIDVGEMTLGKKKCFVQPATTLGYSESESGHYGCFVNGNKDRTFLF